MCSTLNKELFEDIYQESGIDDNGLKSIKKRRPTGKRTNVFPLQIGTQPSVIDFLTKSQSQLDAAGIEGYNTDPELKPKETDRKRRNSEGNVTEARVGYSHRSKELVGRLSQASVEDDYLSAVSGNDSQELDGNHIPIDQPSISLADSTRGWTIDYTSGIASVKNNGNAIANNLNNVAPRTNTINNECLGRDSVTDTLFEQVSPLEGNNSLKPDKCLISDCNYQSGQIDE